MRRVLIIICWLMTSSVLYGQESSTSFGASLELGNVLAWWKYNRGVGLGWDRTDNLRVPQIAGGLYVQRNAWQLSLLATQEWYGEKYFELFEDMVDQRRRQRFSDGTLPITNLELKVHHLLINNPRYAFGLGAGIGTFFLSTLLPLEDNFGSRYSWSAEVMNKLKLNDRVWGLFSINYQKKHIAPEFETAEGQGHEIFSYGLKLGIQYTLIR